MNQIRKTYKKLRIIPARVLIRKIVKILTGNSKKINNHRKFLDALRNDEITFFTDAFSLFYDYFPAITEIENNKFGLTEKSDIICQHVFDLLGSGPTNLNKKDEEISYFGDNPENLMSMIKPGYHPINWGQDFKSGYTWNCDVESDKLLYGNINGVDVKVPWELGRLQHLIFLCYSGVIDKVNDNYINEYYSQLIDFILSNPVAFGIQWKSSMDVSIRAINILFSYLFLKINAISINPDFEKLLLRNLYEHLIYIYYHLEWNEGLRGNHYFFNLTGLIVLSSVIDSPITKEIRDFAINEFNKELNYQFNSDGSNFEASIHYHFFTTEAVLLVNNILKKQHIKIIESSSKIESIKNFCRANINIEHEIFNIGDNDSGYLLKLHPEDLLNNNTNNYKYVVRQFDKIYKKSEVKSFPDFGLFMLRNDLASLAFRCGSLGQKGKGGHAHNDQLSFVLNIHDKQVFVDAGSYCYTPYPQTRNKFRATQSHNTLSLDGKEQNDFLSNNSGDLFWLSEKTHSKLIELNENVVSGIHYGYNKPCKRTITFFNNEITVIDECKIKAEKIISFHVHPDISILAEEDKIILTNQNITLEIQADVDKKSIEDYKFSPSYGITLPAKKIRLFSEKDLITTKIKIL